MTPRHPWLALKMNVTRNPLTAYPSAASVRENFFCKHTPQDVVDDAFLDCQMRASRRSSTTCRLDVSDRSA